MYRSTRFMIVCRLCKALNMHKMFSFYSAKKALIRYIFDRLYSLGTSFWFYIGGEKCIEKYLHSMREHMLVLMILLMQLLLMLLCSQACKWRNFFSLKNTTHTHIYIYKCSNLCMNSSNHCKTFENLQTIKTQKKS